MPAFKPIADAAPEGGGVLVMRLCREDELADYKDLVKQNHYLKSDRSAGDTLRYIAELDGRKVALLTWGAAAYKLKERDRWIDWGTGLRKARLKLVVQNRRLCLLTKPGEMPNLASQVMGACLRRLRQDWLEHFSYTPLIAETFVDPDYAQGTCYKATNWQPLGLTAGSGRHARDFYQKHNRPKTLWCLELVVGARRLLADPAPLPDECRGGVLAGAVKGTAAGAATCKSLLELFEKLPDPRSRSGLRYPQKQLLSILALGMLCGCQTLQDIVLLGQSLTQPQLRALGGWKRKKTGMYEAPAYNAYYNLIGQMDAEAFNAKVCQWLNEREGNLPRDLALDGKILRGTIDANGHQLGLVALVEKGTERLVAQQARRVVEGEEEKSKQEGELTAARRLLDEIPSLDNAVVTSDANLCRPDIARRIVQEKGGDYLLALKDNNPKLHAAACRAFDGGFPGAQTPLFGKVK